jgi:hypothetical protein
MRQSRSDAGALKAAQPQVNYGDGMRDAPEDFARFYRTARTREAKEKARLFSLRNGRLTGTLLDRKLLGREIHEIFSSVKDIVLGSNALTPKGKAQLLNCLTHCVEAKLIEKLPEPADPPAPKEKPSNWTSYQFQRLNEVTARAENFRLRSEVLHSELLDRQMFEAEMGRVTSAIQNIIESSKLSPKDKRDALRNLSGLPQVYDTVIRTQKASALAPRDGSGTTNGSTDEETL